MTNSILNKRLNFLQFFLIILVAASGNYFTVNAQSLPSKALSDIVESRETARTYVRSIKNDWDSSTKEYKEAKKKYGLAKAKYDGWVAAVKFAILTNTVEDLSKDKSYKKQCEETTKTIKAFVDYAESLPTKPQEKGILSILTSLFDLGGKVVDKIGDYKKKSAEAAEIKAKAAKTLAEAEKIRAETREKIQPILKDISKSFEEAAQWQDWNSILAD